MQIGLYMNKKTNEVLYFEREEKDFWMATSLIGERKIPITEENNYQQIDYFQARKIEKDLRKIAGWLERLLDSKFEEDGEIQESEILRQICILKKD